ncbi:MAG: hypothetical protein HKP58_02110, partial [Desulfatitalea sp.]|nr:hypothetical protein [Desulfatitalea sp.]NNJ99183.1 hypothetical protein [Desulfatitalea sp.]
MQSFNQHTDRQHPHRRPRPGWREYQQQLNGRRNGRLVRRAVIALSVAAIVGIYLLALDRTMPGAAPTPAEIVPLPAPPAAAPLISKQDVRLLLAQLTTDQLAARSIDLPFNHRQFNVETSLDPQLQSNLSAAMDRKNSRYIGIVAMEAESGRILTLAGFDKTDPAANPCLRQTFPAASLFKIVTSAAAVDVCGYTEKTTLHFNGYK